HGRGRVRCGGDQGAVGRSRSRHGRAEDAGRVWRAMTSETVDITVNGEQRAVPRGASLLELLQSLALDPRAVVVGHNPALVRRPALGQVKVAPGDAVELVHFVGGG